MNELGNPKGKKPKEIPLHSEICEPVKAYLDVGEDVPLPLLARLLKFKLLDTKLKDVRRRDSERKVSLSFICCAKGRHLLIMGSYL